MSPQCNVTNIWHLTQRLVSRCILLILFIYTPHSFAENLIDIFNLAIENDSELKAAQYAKQADQTKEPQAYSKLYPKIYAQGSSGKVSQNLINAAFPGSGSESILGQSVYNQISVSLNLIQPLYNVKTFRSLKISEIESTKAELDYRIAQQDLIFRIAEAYFDVLSGSDELSFARAEKNAITKQLQQTKQRFQVGLTAVTDVHEAQARHDLALAQEIKAETELAKRQESLRRITGKIHDNLMRLKIDMPLVPPSPSNMEDWTEAAKNQNFSIATIKYNADIIKQEMDVLRGDHFPTIDLSASYGYNTHGGPYLQESTDAIISLNFNMPLFEGNIVSHKLAELRHRFDQSIQEIDIQEKLIIQQTRQAYLGVLAGMSYVKALNQALQSSEKALRATNAGFEVGTRTAIEVLDAQRELFRGQRDYARARYDYLMNTLKLKIAVGLLSIDDLEQINTWLE